MDLMHKAIESKNDPAAESVRLSNFKEKMAAVRGLSNSWDSMSNFCIKDRVSVCANLRKVLDIVCKCRNEMGITEIMCMCTYVSEVCLVLISKDEKHEISKIVETLVDYMLDRNMMSCVHFLDWLDIL